MNEILIIALSGSVGAGLIKMIDGIIQYCLHRWGNRTDMRYNEKQVLNSINNNLCDISIKLGDTDKRVTEIARELDSLKHAQKTAMYERVSFLARRAIDKGEITIDEKIQISKLHCSAKLDLGANGDLDSLIRVMEELPIKKD